MGCKNGVCSNDPGHVTKMAAMPIYDKIPLKTIFSETSRVMTFELTASGTQGGGPTKFGPTKFVQMMILG